MKTAAVSALLLVCLACAPTRPPKDLYPSDVKMTIFYSTGGPAPLAWQARYVAPDTMLLQVGPERFYHFRMIPKQVALLEDTYQSPEFVARYAAQKALGPRYGCCDRAEVGISFEAAPSITAINDSVSFPTDEGLPGPVSTLLTVVNDILASRGYPPLLEKWELQ